MDDPVTSELDAPATGQTAPSPRSRSRSRGRRRRKANWGGRLLAAVGVLVVLLVAGFFGFKLWLKGYIQGPAFRGELNEEISNRLKARTDIEGLAWDDNAARISRISATGHLDAAFSRASIDDIRAEVKLDLLGRALDIPDITVSRARFTVSDEGRIPTLFSRGENADGTAAPPRKEGFLDSFKPKRFSIKEARIESVEAIVRADGTEARLENLPVVMKPGPSLKEWNLSSHPTDGRAVLLANLGGGFRLKIADLAARVKPGQFELLNLEGEVERLQPTAGFNNDLGRTRLSCSASYHDSDRGAHLDFDGRVTDLKLQDWVREDWVKRLTGTADLKVKATQTPDAPLRAEGTFIVKQGVLQGLPVLANLAEKTKTLEFTQLQLNTARCDFKHTGDEWHLHRIEIESRGLLRIEGYVTIRGGQLTGLLNVGAAPGRLRPIDGAEQRVFTRDENGYKWAVPPMKIWGTLDDIQEDLGGRIKDAWLDQQIENVTDLAVKAPEAAVQTGTKAVETGTKLLEQGMKAAPDILDKGAELFQGLFGGSRKRLEEMPAAPSKLEPK
ncbi:MAG: hypothetical protein KA004_06675 [Verrucomicrobiales bacterium]|nr:hypothetical protein [Verrucomicrobiales bacterium]